MARPKHGGGTVFHRKDGRYVTQIRLRWYEQKLRALQAAGVLIVARGHAFQHLSERHRDAFGQQLAIAPLRAHLRRCGQEELKWCVWKDFVASNPAKKALDAWKEKRP